MAVSTIQFDFNLPEDLTSIILAKMEKSTDHLWFIALLGSIERFFGILIEHYAGDFPLWLAPVQAVVIPVSQNFFEYAQSINDKLVAGNIRTHLDLRNEKIGYKIRDWETQKVPNMIIVGEKEQNATNISVRQHKKGDLGAFTLIDFIDKLATEIKNKDYTTN
jgi:threonyl-tRNA synthetase